MTTKRRFQLRWSSLATCLTVLVALVGCSDSGEMPRFDLSGTITFEGKPVPVGYIVFAPNTELGNTGPGSQADIQEGKYSTRSGHGTIGGPHIVTVFGFDGKPYKIEDGNDGPPMTNPMGRPMFETTIIKIDLPKEPAIHDFVIPKK